MTPHQNLNHSYQRLEFLGDRVLNLIVSQYLYEKYSGYSEGELTEKLKFTSNDNLEEIIESLPDEFRKDLFKFKCGFDPDAVELNADDVEAYIGNFYLKHGLEEAINYFKKIFAEKIDTYDPLTDYISRLKIYCEQNKKPQPDYQLVRAEKVDNNQNVFHFRVCLNDVLHGLGKGRTHSKAKKQAAFEALKKIGSYSLIQ